MLCQCMAIYVQDSAKHTELISVNLESEGPNTLGLALKFDDSKQLIIEEIKSDGIAAKVCLVMHDSGFL